MSKHEEKCVRCGLEITDEYTVPLGGLYKPNARMHASADYCVARLSAALAEREREVARIEGQAEMATRGLESAAATIAAQATQLAGLQAALKKILEPGE